MLKIATARPTKIETEDDEVGKREAGRPSTNPRGISAEPPPRLLRSRLFIIRPSVAPTLPRRAAPPDTSDKPPLAAPPSAAAAPSPAGMALPAPLPPFPACGTLRHPPRPVTTTARRAARSQRRLVAGVGGSSWTADRSRRALAAQGAPAATDRKSVV